MIFLSENRFTRLIFFLSVIARYPGIVTGRDRSHCLPALPRVCQHVMLSDVSLGTRPPYSLVVDEEVKKPTKQANKQSEVSNIIIIVLFPRGMGDFVLVIH